MAQDNLRFFSFPCIKITLIFIKIHQTKLDLYIHIKCYIWATSFRLIMTTIQAPYAKNISYL